MKKIAYTLIILAFSLKSLTALEEIQKYEDYLNELKTLVGEFTQVSNKGQPVTGTIQISRPGKLRLTYNPPSKLLIVADGEWLITKDTQSNEINYSSLDKTPAAFILRPNIRFSGDVQVTNVVSQGDSTAISLVRKDEPDTGYITLVFSNNPVILKEWSVIDAQGTETQVTLSNVKSNVDLPRELFLIESPSLLQQIF